MFRIHYVFGRKHPLCAIRGAVRVFAGILACELLQIDGTLRNSKILHIHKSEYTLRYLAVTILKTQYHGILLL